MPRWQGFERLAEKIMQDLNPHADVKWNEKIRGRYSDVRRQIDVSVRWMDGESERLLVIDAKDWSTPADISDVERFAGLARDVGANRGLLVCNKGFTAAAPRYARNLGVELYNLHDAESHDWSRDLTIPIIWVDYKPEIRAHAEIWFNAGDSPVPDENFPFIFSPGGGNADEPLGDRFEKVTVLDSFVEAWNSRQLPSTLGQYHRIRNDTPLRALVEDANGERIWRPVKAFVLTYLVKRVARLGHFRPTQCRGLIDYLDSEALIISYLPMSEVPANPDMAWQEIQDPDAVALSVRGTIATSAGMIVLDAGSGTTEDVTFHLIKERYDGTP